MYVRAIVHVSEWQNCKKIGDLPIVVVSDWATKEDSDYSVFEIDDMSNKETLDFIALRLFLDNPAKYNTFCLMPFNEDDLSQFQILPDINKKINCLHANITKVKYSDLDFFISYTQKHIGNGAQYEIFDLKEMIIKIDEVKLTEYVKELVSNSKDGSEKNWQRVQNKFGTLNNVLFKKKGFKTPVKKVIFSN